jgi:glycerol kinase
LEVLCSKTVESTALGAAYLAGIGAGEVSLKDVSKNWSPKAEYKPDSSYDIGRYYIWKEFLSRLIS